MGKIAVVGVGYWGPNLIRNFLALRDLDGVIACDPDRDRLDLALKRFPNVEVSTSFEDVVRRADVEAVAIATPTRLHYRMVKAALSAGKHVLVEKPMATDVDEARQLVELARSRELTLMVDHTFIYNGAVEKIAEFLDTGELGDILYIDSVRVNLGLFQSDVNVIWDLAPHDLSIVGALLKRSPKTVRAVAQSHIARGMEDVGYVHVDYGDNISAAFHVSWLAPTKVRRMMVCGTRRMIIWNDMDEAEKIRVYDRGVDLVPWTQAPVSAGTAEEVDRYRVDYRMGDVRLPLIDRSEPLEKLTRHFVDCCRFGDAPRTGAQEGLDVVLVLAATSLSLANGGRAVSTERGRLELI
jgi:predicted dehydrogenase